MPKRYALINSETNIVENVIMLMQADVAPDGYYVVQSDDANPNDTYNGSTFVPPPDRAPE